MSVAETFLPGAREHRVVPSRHTFIMLRPSVVEMTDFASSIQPWTWASDRPMTRPWRVSIMFLSDAALRWFCSR